jgi:hypothetical protein
MPFQVVMCIGLDQNYPVLNTAPLCQLNLLSNEITLFFVVGKSIQKSPYYGKPAFINIIGNILRKPTLHRCKHYDGVVLGVDGFHVLMIVNPI